MKQKAGSAPTPFGAPRSFSTRMKKAVPFGMPPGRENVMTDDRRNDRESTIVRRRRWWRA
jgi:hypothetical protein